LIYLESERLFLRAFRAQDWQDLLAYLSRPEVVKYEPYEVFDETSCQREAIQRSENRAFWAVCLKETGKMIGNLYFNRIEPLEFSTWELGYVFNPDYSGRGYATEACARIIEYGFHEQNAHRIIALCNPENQASWKLLERLGMTREGYFKKQVFFKRSPEGQALWCDTYQYALLDEEYQNIK